MGRDTKKTARKRKRAHNTNGNDNDNGRTISVRNVPTTVDFCVVLGDVASYLARALSLEAKQVQDENGKDVAHLVAGDDETNVLASLRLVPQRDKQTGRVRCRGFGFLKLEPNSETSLNPAQVVTTLNSYSSQNPLVSSGTTTTLLLRCGSFGQEAEESLLAQGKEESQHVMDNAGAKLRTLIKLRGGSLHLKDWPKEDQKIVNEWGKRRRLRPKDAAEAAGISWNGATQMFSLIKTEES